MNTAQYRALASRNILFLLLTSCLTFLIVGCEDPGVVGGGFTDTNTAVKVDTLMVNGIETESYNFYSGNLTYFSVGQFSDPLFGDMKATGLIRPQLISTSSEMADTANMKLRLVFNQDVIYGDSLHTAEFDIIELNQVWRGNAWNLKDEPQFDENATVASFTVEKEDSIEVDLSESWMQAYREFATSEAADRDSTYRINFPGLAIVPKSSGKIIPIDAQESDFIIENPESDTLQVSARDWAYSLDRANVSAAPSQTFKLHSTFEQVINFDLDLTRENIGSVNLSKVELVFYEDRSELDGSLSQMPPSTGRAPITSARLQLVEPSNIPIVLQTGSILSNANYDEEEGSYRFDITSFTNSVLIDGIPSELKFYVSLETNSGIIRSSLIHDEEAPAEKRPKIIVTYVQNQES
ncbi:DUF4270 domain-containing protein [Aliifodinibius sp. S!AR15-10]|uniref:hypothetical protein n=1 Tax=Aliifodinibius sp. S!AR15-10 TaxID=2950437 RepID=UPI00285A545A|nr:hypothetical protein [Aliifodinibius sp. S!AR15-10]MDR8392978.1 DUF4270 domain-containing protein [Aliifodinibius sp. S!AR15-10]